MQGKNRDGRIDGGPESMPGAPSEHFFDDPCDQQGLKPGIKLFARGAADLFSLRRRQFTKLQPCQAQKRVGLALNDSSSLARFHPDLCGGSLDVLYRFQVLFCAPQSSFDALGWQADLLNDVGQFVTLAQRQSGRESRLRGHS